MKKTQPRKMTLTRETLRNLSDAPLEQAAGARPTSLDTRCDFCDTYQATCTSCTC
jgi:hypothetical protein